MTPVGGVSSTVSMQLIPSTRRATIDNNSALQQVPLDSLYALGRRIRKSGTDAELSEIEEEIDGILETQRARSAAGDENAVDDATLNVAAHRLESLIHDRRTMLETKPAIASAG
jgi:hypothetical protein